MADTLAVNRIVRYDGVNNIMMMGEGLNDAVLALAWHTQTNSLIVGGVFSSSGGNQTLLFLQQFKIAN